MSYRRLKTEYSFRYGSMDVKHREIFSEYFETQIRRPHLSVLLDCVTGLASIDGRSEFERTRDQFLRSIMSDNPVEFINNLVDMNELRKTDAFAQVFLDEQVRFYIDGYVKLNLNGNENRFVKECSSALNNMKIRKNTLHWIVQNS